MTFRRYDVLQPANEKELGDHLRSYALAEAALKLIVMEQLNELDKKRFGETRSEEATMTIDSVHMGSGEAALPYIVGEVSHATNDKKGNGRLEVVGSRDMPESDRSLILHVYEYEKQQPEDID